MLQQLPSDGSLVTPPPPVSSSSSVSSRRTSQNGTPYKEAKKQYAQSKAAKRGQMALYPDMSEDPVLSNYVWFRSMFRNWHRFYCTVRPGMIVYYKERECIHWAGTVLLLGGQVIERPTKMGGYG
eukprot:UC1_evm1s1626